MLYLFSYILLLSFGFIVLRVLAPRDYKNRGKLSPFISFLQALLFFLYGGFPLIYLESDWPAVSVSPFLHGLGLVLLITGLAYVFYGMIRLGIARSIGRGAPRLTVSGIYGRTRNPQILACGLYVLGFFILWPTWYALGWVFLYLILIYMMVPYEEEHLRRKYGREYGEYCENVPRFIGLRSFRKTAPP